MESTSFLPYQSGSYMSAKHAWTFLEDSCIADDNDTCWHEWNSGRRVHVKVYDYICMLLIRCIYRNTFDCFQVRPQVPLQLGAFSLRSKWVEKTKTNRQKQMGRVLNCRNISVASATGRLTYCLLKLITPSSKAASLVSSALPSFWRTLHHKNNSHKLCLQQLIKIKAENGLYLPVAKKMQE